jgi:hypothetical protein
MLRPGYDVGQGMVAEQIKEAEHNRRRLQKYQGCCGVTVVCLVCVLAFLFIKSDPEPLCGVSCGQHGSCHDKSCVCTDDYSGASCEVRLH